MPKIVDHDARRAELAAALWRVAARDGLAAASIRSVAAEAGWSAGALRHYFADKDDMLLFALDHAVSEVSGRIGAYDPDAADLPGLRRHLEELLPLDPRRRVESEAWLALVTRAQQDRPMRTRRRRVDAMIRGVVETVVRRLGALGHLAPHRDPDAETARLHALLDGLVIQRLAQPPTLSAAQARRILHLHLDDLAR